jgi:hypothetical protein
MTLSQDKSNRMVGHLVRAAVRLGLGRGRLKHVFAKAWLVAVGTGPVMVRYISTASSRRGELSSTRAADL